MQRQNCPQLSFEWLAGYGIGTAGTLLARAWEASGKLKVIGSENIPHAEKPLVIVSNHPGMAEAVFLPFVFVGPLPIRPALIPLSTPDKSNFHDKWYWAWARSFFIEIDRKDDANKKIAFRRIIRELEGGRRVILFLEEGRTDSVPDGHIYSPSGRHRIRPFSDSLGLIVQHLDVCTVLHVWVDGSTEFLPRGKAWPNWRVPVTVRIGPPKVYRQEEERQFRRNRRERATQITQDTQSLVLALADESHNP